MPHAGARERSPAQASGALQALAAVSHGKAPALTHCRHMFDLHGMVQFASGDRPDLTHGYCLDDNARALLVAVMVLSLVPANDVATEIGERALAFAHTCRRPDGRFHNLMSADGSFTDDVGSQDSLARLIWACGVTARCAPYQGWRDGALALLESALEHASDLQALRPIAYATLGLAALVAPGDASPLASVVPAPTGPFAQRITQTLRGMCARLIAELHANSAGTWRWFEPMLSWGNARLPEALLRASVALPDSPLLPESGLTSLAFLGSITHSGDRFVPIGNHGWYERGSRRAIYDQQPIEACTMVDAWLAAARLTDRIEYESKALEAFSWFVGLNTEGLALADEASGGCHDGLAPGEINPNMGAESTLSFLHAHAALAAHLKAKVLTP